ncbi:MAG: peptidyl-prolyl cis-trans isomerase [bacterium]
MRDIVVSTLTIGLLLVILVLVLLGPGGSQPASTMLPEQHRTLAAALEAQGLYQEAVDEYTRYLDTASIPEEQRANLLYRIGTLYLDQLADYENALASFIRISHLYPKASVTREAEMRMVRCFEELRRGSDAQRKLKQLTDLKPEEEEPGTGPVVAQIGGRQITRDQLERELDQLPEAQRKIYEDPEKKREYLQSRLIQELFYDMALRKEYDKNKDIRKQVRDFEKMLLANRIMEEEVRRKVQVTPGDIELYYQAHPEEYTVPLTLRLAHIQVSTPEKAQEVKKAIDEGKPFEQAVTEFSEDAQTKNRGGELGTLQEGRDTVPGIGPAKDIADQLLALAENQVSGPIQGPNGYHLFKVLQRTPGRRLPLEEVQSQVERQVWQRKALELQNDLVQRLLKAETVKIFDPSLVEPGPAPAGPPNPRQPAPGQPNSGQSD